MSAAQIAVIWAGFVPAGIIVLCAALCVVGRLTVWRDPPSRHAIIAEYGPDPTVDIASAAVILRREDDGAFALLLDEAVRGEIALLRAPNGRGGVTISVEEPGGRRSLAWQYLHDHCEPAVRAAYERLTSGDAALRARPSGYLSAVIALFVILAWAGSWLGGVAAAIIGFASGEPGWAWLQIGIAVGVAVLGIVVAFLVSRFMPLTAAGVAARDRLLGLRVYVDVAEVHRLRILFGPRTAEAEPAPAPGGIGDQRTERIELPSRLIPYGVLFSTDRSWRRALDSLTFVNPNASGADRFFAPPRDRAG